MIKMKKTYVKILLSTITLLIAGFDCVSQEVNEKEHVSSAQGIDNYKFSFGSIPHETIEENRRLYSEEISLLKKSPDQVIEGLLEKQLVKKYEGRLNIGARKVYDIAAICQIASEVKSVTPLYFMKDNYADEFDRCLNFRRKYFMGGYKANGPKLEEYPFIYLAVQCGEKSVDPLREIALDSKVNVLIRIKSFITLYKIDEKSAKAIAPLMYDSMDEDYQSIITSFLKDPTLQPWDIRDVRIPDRFRKRIEAGKKFKGYFPEK